MTVVNPPKENVAQNVLMIVSTATTKIKQEITKSVAEGIDQEELTKTLNKIIDEYCKRIDNLELREKTRKSLVTSSRKWYYQLSQTINILNRNVINNFPGGTYTADLRAIMGDLNKINLNAIRPYLDQTRKGLAVIEDYRQKLHVALKALAAEPPKMVEAEGRKAYTVSLRNRAEMTVRYEANMRDLERLIAEGVEYVWTTSHPDASPRCAPHQGKLYSLNPENKTGVIDGIRYTYLPDVLKLNGGNSIINGYNCRHRLIPYQKGSAPPMEYTKEEIQREYRNDQIQRRYENQIRQLKTEERLMRAAGNVEEAKKLRKRWRRLTKKYEIESLKMGRAFYRWRTVVSEDEEYYTATIDENELINAPKNGIIDIYSEERKANAYRWESRVKADDLLRPATEKAWKKMSIEERKAMYDYTLDSTDINSTLRRGEFNPGNYIGKQIVQMTSAIDKSVLDHDIWLKRKTTLSGLCKYLGLERPVFNKMSVAQLKKMFYDAEIPDEGFVSTSTAEDAEYVNDDVELDVTYVIYAPKGTKAMYVEPFSAYNANFGKKGLNWDGKSKPVNQKGETIVGSEAEVLIQRGYHYRIKDIIQKGKKITVIKEVVLKGD